MFFLKDLLTSIGSQVVDMSLSENFKDYLNILTVGHNRKVGVLIGCGVTVGGLMEFVMIDGVEWCGVVWCGIDGGWSEVVWFDRWSGVVWSGVVWL